MKKFFVHPFMMKPPVAVAVTYAGHEESGYSVMEGGQIVMNCDLFDTIEEANAQHLRLVRGYLMRLESAKSRRVGDVLDTVPIEIVPDLDPLQV